MEGTPDLSHVLCMLDSKDDHKSKKPVDPASNMSAVEQKMNSYISDLLRSHGSFNSLGASTTAGCTGSVGTPTLDLNLDNELWGELMTMTDTAVTEGVHELPKMDGVLATTPWPVDSWKDDDTLMKDVVADDTVSRHSSGDLLDLFAVDDALVPEAAPEADMSASVKASAQPSTLARTAMPEPKPRRKQTPVPEHKRTAAYHKYRKNNTRIAREYRAKKRQEKEMNKQKLKDLRDRNSALRNKVVELEAYLGDLETKWLNIQMSKS